MSLKKIFEKVTVDNMVKDGKLIAISAATETTNWRRTDAVAKVAGAALKENITSYSKPLPADTQEVCSRESTHQSPADMREHITAVCFNSKNEATTIHIPVIKKP